MYNKLFTKILDSSIWLENQPTRIVWITFIAMMDQDGTVALSSIGNVANRARVSLEEAEEAVRCLEHPDHHNPDQDNEGRRIERIPGIGWVVLNAKKYRDIIKAETVRAQTRERTREYRERMKDADGDADVTQGDENVTLSEAEAEAKNKEKVAETAPPDVQRVFNHWQTVCKKPDHSLTKSRRTFIGARLKEFTVEQLCQAINIVAATPFYAGVNDRNTEYLDFKTIFKNQDQVENFLFTKSLAAKKPEMSEEERKGRELVRLSREMSYAPRST